MVKLMVKMISAVLFVEEIEPCTKFWVERLGFEKTVEVPEGDKLGFVILQQGNVEVMYQSFDSAEKDVPAIAKEIRKGPTFLYIEVEHLEPIIEKLKGASVYMPVRTAFYGMKEIGVRDPAGHCIVFAAPAAQPAH
jgi:uncharacterized glyoxalase superfamily protein PhnB